MQKSIVEGWQAGLDILKPSAAELEHGLELHRNSIVVDTYGFAPAAAVDPEPLLQAQADGASPLEIQDMVEDMIMTRRITDPLEREEFMGSWEHAGVTCIMQNAGEEGQEIDRLIKRLAHYIHVCDALPGFVRKAVGPGDIIDARKEGRHAFYMSCNGVPLPQTWVSVEEELRYIRIFFQLGCRMMHLTYNRRNMIGDGCGESANAGLSDFGRQVIAEMNRQGVIVDVAHSGWRTSLEAAQVSQKPVVASHSVCHALNPHCRSKPDDVIRAIADSGGYIGICCIQRFLGGKGSLGTLLDHVDHVVKNFGADYVAIGTDSSYTPPRYMENIKKALGESRRRARWESLWPSGALAQSNWEERATLSLTWTNWPLFTVGLVQKGYADEDIRKIIGGNALRVAAEVLRK